MKKRFTHLLVLTFCIVTLGKAQDIHFSQYYASPITLNPALTGLINGDFRAVLNHRSQWFAIPTQSSIASYATYQASADMPLLTRRLDGSVFGVGLMFYADEAGNGSLTTQSAMASISYHQKVDRFGRSKIGIGMQGGFVHKRVFEHDLLFEAQFDNLLNTFNPFLDNLEDDFTDGNFMYGDLNIGAMWSSRPTDNFKYYLGFAVNHIAKPNESFLGSGNKIDQRYIAHGAAEFSPSDYFRVTPTFLYMLQSNNQQFNLGTGFEYDFSDDLIGFAGIWSRLAGGVDGFKADAVIAAVGAEYYNFRLGVSYDLNVSDLKTASKSNGAFEVSLIYIHNKQDEGRIHWERFCPTF